MPVRKSPRRTGATPLFEALVLAWAGVSFHTAPPPPRGIAPVQYQSLREGGQTDEEAYVGDPSERRC